MNGPAVDPRASLPVCRVCQECAGYPEQLEGLVFPSDSTAVPGVPGHSYKKDSRFEIPARNRESFENRQESSKDPEHPAHPAHATKMLENKPMRVDRPGSKAGTATNHPAQRARPAYAHPSPAAWAAAARSASRSEIDDEALWARAFAERGIDDSAYSDHAATLE